MLILIFLIVLSFTGLLIEKLCPRFDVVGGGMCITSFILMIMCLIGSGVRAVSEDSKKAEMQAKHDAIMQMMGNKDNVVTLTRDIAEYNGEILSGREMKKSLWLGFFVYDCYNELPTIEIRHADIGGN